MKQIPRHPSWPWTQLVNHNFIILILSWKRWSAFLAEALTEVWRVGFLPRDWRNPLKPGLREMTTTQTALLHLCCGCSLVLGWNPDTGFLPIVFLSGALKSRQIWAQRNVKILQVACDLLPKELHFESLLSHVGPFPILQGSYDMAQGMYPEPAAWSDMGQTGMGDLRICQSKRELEREELVDNQWTEKKKKTWSLELENSSWGFFFLRNSNLHPVLRRWCPCLSVSLWAVAALGSTACSGICHLNPDLHTLAKQRKIALVSVIYICAFAKVLGFLSSWWRSSCFVLYCKGVIKPNEVVSQCPTTAGYSHSFPHQSQGG